MENDYVTKRDLTDLETRLLAATKRDLDEAIDRVETRLLAAIERSENNLLTAFHSWAPTCEVRVRGTVARVSEFDERRALVEERLSEIERGRKSAN